MTQPVTSTSPTLGYPGSGETSAGRNDYLAPGTRIGRFRIEGLLAKGGMGEVYQAWDPRLERMIVLKSIRLEHEGNPEALERFRREATTLAQLNHPNVCQIHDMVEWEGMNFIQMEFIEGCSLDPLPEDWPTPRKLKLLRDVASAFMEAHAKGIVHRDLKPGNLMVDAHGLVKILDFGLAHIHTDQNAPRTSPNTLLSTHPEPIARVPQQTCLPRSIPSDSGTITQAGIFMGSPAYASPEQVRGDIIGPPSDIFSMGILIQEWMTGQHPFPGENATVRMTCISENQRTMPVGRWPRPLLLLLDRMLAPFPAQRPSAAEVVQCLDRMLDPPKRRGWWIGGTLALLVLAGSAFWALGRGVLADLNRPRIVLLPVENQTGQPGMDALIRVAMPELLGAALKGSPRLDVVDAETLHRTASALKLDLAAPLSAKGKTQLLSATGAKLVLQAVLELDQAQNKAVFRFSLKDLEGRSRVEGRLEGEAQEALNPQLFSLEAGRRIRKAVDPYGERQKQETPLSPQVLSSYAEGRAALQRGAYKEAEKMLREAAYGAPTFAPALEAYAECLARLGDPQNAPVAQWARLAALQAGDRLSEAKLLGQMGLRAQQRGALDEAIQLEQQALGMSRSLGATDLEFSILIYLGSALRESGRLQEAEECYQKAVSLARSQENRLAEARALNSLAILHQNRQQFQVAESQYRRALELVREIQSPYVEASALNNLATILVFQGRLQEAQITWKKALRMYERTGLRNGQAATLGNLGILRLMEGKYSEAEALQSQSLALAQAGGLILQASTAHFYLGEGARRQKAWALAQSHYRQALSLLPTTVPKVLRAQSLAALGETLIRQNLAQKAASQAAIDEAAKCAPSNPYVLRAQGFLARALKQPEAARDYFDQARQKARTEAPELAREIDQELP